MSQRSDDERECAWDWTESGGNWPGDPDDTTDIGNAAYMIDYVRVYQKGSCDENK